MSLFGVSLDKDVRNIKRGGVMSAQSAQQTPAKPRVVDSQTLLAGQTQVVIQHGSAQYRLCVTKENRLILTK
jgi:hemin uptake protein HemP